MDKLREHDGSMCAHLNVKYAPVDNGNGTMSDRWVCALCGHDFWPKQWLFPAPWQREAALRQQTPAVGERPTASQRALDRLKPPIDVYDSDADARIRRAGYEAAIADVRAVVATPCDDFIKRQDVKIILAHWVMHAKKPTFSQWCAAVDTYFPDPKACQGECGFEHPMGDQRHE